MDLWTLTSKGNGVRKKDLMQWVSLALKKTLNLNNISKGFKVIKIWPLNPNVMVNKMRLSEAFVKMETPHLNFD